MAVKAAERRRRRGSGLSKAFLLLLLAAVTGIVAVSVFFRVSVVDVEGNAKYSAEEIIKASGIETGQNLFSLRDNSVVINIRKALPYVDKVKIVRDLPDAVTIVVEESVPLASFTVEGAYYIVDKNGKILEQTDFSGAQGTIQIKGIEPILPRAGEKMALGDDGRAQLDFLTQTLTAILSAGIEGDITTIESLGAGSLTFDYQGRFSVSITGGGDAAAKIALLTVAVSRLESSDRGEIDISTENEARFVPG